MIEKRRFIEELRHACKEKEVEYSEIQKWIDRHLKDSKILSYHIALGPNPESPKTLVDIMVLTEDSIRGFEIKTEGNRSYALHLTPISLISEDLKKEWVYMRFYFTQVSTLYMLVDKIEHLEKLRKFAEDVLKQVWRK